MSSSTTAQDKQPNPKLDYHLPPPPPLNSKEGDKLTTSCHCGRVTIKMPSHPKYVNECHCSICYRYGALWTYFGHIDDVVIITAKEPGLTGYLRSEPEAERINKFYFCSHCGCLTHWGPGEKPKVRDDGPGVGVNCRMLPPKLLEGVERETTCVGEF